MQEKVGCVSKEQDDGIADFLKSVSKDQDDSIGDLILHLVELECCMKQYG